MKIKLIACHIQEPIRAPSSTRGMRRSFQTFDAESRPSNREEAYEQPRDVEMVEQAKAEMRSQRDVQEARSEHSRASEVDEKVELKSASPRYYRPDEPLKSSQSAADRVQRNDDASFMDEKATSSLPSNNDAFSELVRRFSQAPSDLASGTSPLLCPCNNFLPHLRPELSAFQVFIGFSQLASSCISSRYTCEVVQHPTNEEHRPCCFAAKSQKEIGFACRSTR